MKVFVALLVLSAVYATCFSYKIKSPTEEQDDAEYKKVQGADKKRRHIEMNNPGKDSYYDTENYNKKRHAVQNEYENEENAEWEQEEMNNKMRRNVDGDEDEHLDEYYGQEDTYNKVRRNAVKEDFNGDIAERDVEATTNSYRDRRYVGDNNEEDNYDIIKDPSIP